MDTLGTIANLGEEKAEALVKKAKEIWGEGCWFVRFVCLSIFFLSVNRL